MISRHPVNSLVKVTSHSGHFVEEETKARELYNFNQHLLYIDYFVQGSVRGLERQV